MDDVKGFGSDSQTFGGSNSIFTLILLFFLIMLLFGKGGSRLFGEEK